MRYEKSEIVATSEKFKVIRYYNLQENEYHGALEVSEEEFVVVDLDDNLVDSFEFEGQALNFMNEKQHEIDHDQDLSPGSGFSPF